MNTHHSKDPKFICPNGCELDKVYSPVSDPENKEHPLHQIYLDAYTGKAINADAMPQDKVREAEKAIDPFCGKCAERTSRNPENNPLDFHNELLSVGDKFKYIAVWHPFTSGTDGGTVTRITKFTMYYHPNGFPEDEERRLPFTKAHELTVKVKEEK